MSRNEYLAELKSFLMSLPSDERDAAIKYYQEFFEDAGEDKEQEVISELGSPKALAESIIAEQNRTEKSSTEFIPANIGKNSQDTGNKYNTNQNNYNNNTNAKRQRNSNNNTALIILLLVLCSPVIIPVVTSVFGVFIGLIAAVFGIWIAAGAIVLALSIGGVVIFAAGIGTLFIRPLEGVLMIGIGLIVFAIGLFFLIPFILICTKLLPAMLRGLVNLFSRIFHRNQVAA